MLPGIAAALVLLPLVLPYYALGTEIVLFALAAVAFDLCLGYTGVMMFCQASFFGTGVYVTALTLIHISQNIFLAVLLGVSAAGLLALLFGWLASSRSGSYSVTADPGLQRTDLLHCLSMEFAHRRRRRTDRRTPPEPGHPRAAQHRPAILAALLRVRGRSLPDLFRPDPAYHAFALRSRTQGHP